MAYDEELALRLQGYLAGEDGLSTKRMFGGLAFLLDGHLTVAASREGGLLLRIDPAARDELLARPHASPMEMGGREPDGWLRIAAEGVDDAVGLRSWVGHAVAYVRGLPPK